MAMLLLWSFTFIGLCLVCHNIECLLGSTLEESFKLNLTVREASFTKTCATRQTASNMYSTKVNINRMYSLTVELLYSLYPLTKIVHLASFPMLSEYLITQTFALILFPEWLMCKAS